MPYDLYRRRRSRQLKDHVGSVKDFRHIYLRQVNRLIQRQQKAKKRIATYPRELFDSERREILSYWCDPRNLYLALQHVKKMGGRAPGKDGICPDYLSKEAWFAEFRRLRPVLEDGSYQPDKPIPVKVSKRSGGYRTIHVANVIDRVFSRAAFQALSPFVEPMFDHGSFGFRPRLSVQHAALEAIWQSKKQGRLVWLAHDIRAAFDRVPRERLFDLLRHWVPAEMLAMIGKLTKADTRRGMTQGSALSPLLLNLYLDHHLDKPWRKQHPKVPLLRYADDILIHCRDQDEADVADKALRKLLLPAGFNLKEDQEEATADLGNGEGSDWLGYRFVLQDKAVVPLMAETARDSLAEHLARASQAKEYRKIAVRDCLRGWFNQMGPTYKSYSRTEREEVYKFVREQVTEYGLQAAVKKKDLWNWWRAGSLKWRYLMAAKPRIKEL